MHACLCPAKASRPAKERSPQVCPQHVRLLLIVLLRLIINAIAAAERIPCRLLLAAQLLLQVQLVLLHQLGAQA